MMVVVVLAAGVGGRAAKPPRRLPAHPRARPFPTALPRQVRITVEPGTAETVRRDYGPIQLHFVLPGKPSGKRASTALMACRPTCLAYPVLLSLPQRPFMPQWALPGTVAPMPHPPTHHTPTHIHTATPAGMCTQPAA
jgi:hypothetical protein